MSNLIVILNVFVIVGLVVSAILAVHFEKLLSSVIALGLTGVFAAADRASIHLFHALAFSIFDALSDRHAGRIWVQNGFFAIARWCSSESTGSSVVQTTLTFDFFMSPRAENHFAFSCLLHFS